jgi:predicted transport protein
MISPKSIHTFHIPVMGLAYTIDSPIRVAPYGISSVISIIDDELVEKMNAFYSKKFNLPYQEITKKAVDYRAERITSYLNLVDAIVKEKFSKLKIELSESKLALEKFIATLPNTSSIKKELSNLFDQGSVLKGNILDHLERHLKAGEIDVNIMTKVDKDNFVDGEQLPVEFNDAHASLRGFANSNLTSSVVLSAGMNPRLYSYFEKFNDFFPDSQGQLKKKVILKVSDYRSASIQGKFLAKKGIWVSEYRVESGLNCGGHAFATEGFLLGPILEEFKNKKAALIKDTHDVLIKALHLKELAVPVQPLYVKITVQGGVGTAAEHEFLMEKYQVDSVGWGTPFLLVPEATSVDRKTRSLLANAKEKDLYLSGISPLGIPFNTIKGTTNEHHKQKRIDNNKAGSSCPKKYLALSKEFSSKGVCTASKKHQDLKLQELEAKRLEITSSKYEITKAKICEKACLCVGLANATYLENDIKIQGQEQGVVICPGPNMAYFDKEVSLSKMMQHIYGNASVLSHVNRPNMFVKELNMYIDYLKNEIASISEEVTARKIKKWEAFKSNLFYGVVYYQNLFLRSMLPESSNIQRELKYYKEQLIAINIPKLE